MKKTLLYFLLIIALSPTVSGQIDSAEVKLYNSWYFFRPELNKKISVFTYEFGDSTITVLAKNKYIRGSLPASGDLQIIPVQDINKIVYRRKGQKAAVLVAGTLTGGIIGGLIGYSNGDDPGPYGASAEVKAFGGAFLGAAIGAGIGVTIGSIKKTVPLDGNVEQYKKVRPKLLKYSIRYYNHKIPLILN